MNYEHPTVRVTTPATGHYVIECPPCKTLTDDGWIVADGVVHISPNCPSELLLAIVADRGETAENPMADEVIESDDGGDLLPRIMAILAVRNIRLNELAEELDVDAESIKALSGNGFEVAHAGWCKPLTKEGEE